MQSLVAVIFAAASCTAALLLTAAPAAAQPETRSVVVSHADLDLAEAAGLATLNRRITAAAKLACGFENTRELARSMVERRCVAYARDQSMTTAIQVAAKRKAEPRASGASIAARR